MEYIGDPFGYISSSRLGFMLLDCGEADAWSSGEAMDKTSALRKVELKRVDRSLRSIEDI